MKLACKTTPKQQQHLIKVFWQLFDDKGSINNYPNMYMHGRRLLVTRIAPEDGTKATWFDWVDYKTFERTLQYTLLQVKKIKI